MFVLNSDRSSDYSRQALLCAVTKVLTYLARKKQSVLRSLTTLRPVKFHFSETLLSRKNIGTSNYADLTGMSQQKRQLDAYAQCGEISIIFLNP